MLHLYISFRFVLIHLIAVFVEVLIFRNKLNFLLVELEQVFKDILRTQDDLFLENSLLHIIQVYGLHEHSEVFYHEFNAE